MHHQLKDRHIDACRSRQNDCKIQTSGSTYPVNGPNNITITPYAIPTNMGTDDGGTHVLGLVAANIMKQTNPVPNPSINAAWNALSTFPYKLLLRLFHRLKGYHN